ncbi:hypothetical protein GCM10009104_33090 [Marinobacterium maritimum]|uniref:Uncharacterized protein n=1 Tax=Marinobacterium maritimum TaxID=500162 RepID=A0ABN1IA50_9GAMM
MKALRSAAEKDGPSRLGLKSARSELAATAMAAWLVHNASQRASREALLKEGRPVGLSAERVIDESATEDS